MARRKRNKQAAPKPPPSQLVGRCRVAIQTPWAMAIHDVMVNWVYPLDSAIERMQAISEDTRGDTDGRRREQREPLAQRPDQHAQPEARADDQP